MANSLFGRMMELAADNCNNSYSEPMIINNECTRDSGKLTIDFNVNLHVYHHDANKEEDTEDNTLKLINF